MERVFDRCVSPGETFRSPLCGTEQLPDFLADPAGEEGADNRAVGAL
ncbi:hypothetical protein [Streptomyces sp. NPDC059957]